MIIGWTKSRQSLLWLRYIVLIYGCSQPIFFLSNSLTVNGVVTIPLSSTRMVLTKRCTVISYIHGNLLSLFYFIFIQPYFILNEFACFLLSKSKREFSFNSQYSYQPSHFLKMMSSELSSCYGHLSFHRSKPFFFTTVISENLHKDQTTNLRW